jgi:hypothetical protein
MVRRTATAEISHAGGKRQWFFGEKRSLKKLLTEENEENGEAKGKGLFNHGLTRINTDEDEKGKCFYTNSSN